MGLSNIFYILGTAKEFVGAVLEMFNVNDYIFLKLRSM